MAASANPSKGHSNANGNTTTTTTTTNGGDAANSNGVSAADNSVVGGPALRHNPGLSLDWTSDEQSKLEELLSQYASEPNIVRYAKIAQALKDKTVRDVALRCRWMNKKENGKRRKDDHNSSKKNKDKKEKVTDSLPKSSQVANCSNGPPYVQSMMSMDSDDGISYKAIGGATGQLLEQNAQALDQISANFAAFKIHENINLFCQARASILSILNDFNDLPEIMKQMPPLPVKLNEELASSILPQTSLAKKS
uniref:DIV and RAD interacting factor 1 n=1 Tax=Antirrhinum majus TaxID=4151 RepID=R4L0E0_ANTMA|nr:DIV and RAD interacting factor 1 [Antirrhinum majus]